MNGIKTRWTVNQKPQRPLYEVKGKFLCDDCGVDAALLKVLTRDGCKLVLCRECLNERVDYKPLDKAFKKLEGK
jgi:ribosomal protein S14